MLFPLRICLDKRTHHRLSRRLSRCSCCKKNIDTTIDIMGNDNETFFVLLICIANNSFRCLRRAQKDDSEKYGSAMVILQEQIAWATNGLSQFYWPTLEKSGQHVLYTPCFTNTHNRDIKNFRSSVDIAICTMVFEQFLFCSVSFARTGCPGFIHFKCNNSWDLLCMSERIILKRPASQNSQTCSGVVFCSVPQLNTFVTKIWLLQLHNTLSTE